MLSIQCFVILCKISLIISVLDIILYMHLYVRKKSFNLYFLFSIIDHINCSEQTRVMLTSAAYMHLKNIDVSKHTRNLTPASRAILLSGPAGCL